MPSTTNGTPPKIDFQTFHNVINGQLTATEHTTHGVNPATKKSNPDVPVSTKEDLDLATEAARVAFPKWAKSTIEERATALNNYANALMAHQEEFAQLLTREQGKPVKQCFLNFN